MEQIFRTGLNTAFTYTDDTSSSCCGKKDDKVLKNLEKMQNVC